MLSAPGPESSWQEDAFSYPVGASGSSFIYLLDLLSSRRLMVDSGASILVSPAPGYGWLVFVREDTSVSPLAPLYHGPYLGDRADVVSVDRLKPAFSDEPISSALPPVCGRPVLNPVLVPCQLLPPPPAVVQVPVCQKKVRK